MHITNFLSSCEEKKLSLQKNVEMWTNIAKVKQSLVDSGLKTSKEACELVIKKLYLIHSDMPTEVLVYMGKIVEDLNVKNAKQVAGSLYKIRNKYKKDKEKEDCEYEI